ncbi:MULTISPECIES: outer membrane protein assembly factor BamA [Qipengyuania]|uniref:Outer membrane protein assembly factor BamA n=1 Tax=Qipengyuania soli TaxID=2782568 RepID=A0A7S8F5Y6_9SPHN|nr:outer membrane protein assembly factor BamA [Qipengyuania soli]QPC99700.1 outer membrane protein assembly factor BamA [Qipengyuania soli]
MTDFATAATRRSTPCARLAISLLAGTMLAGIPQAAMAQEATDAAAAQAAPAAQSEVVRTIAVAGAQRLEPQTILSYIRLRPGDVWSQAVGDQVLKDLYATELFSNASVVNNDGNVVITIVENPVVNRIIIEGNKRLKVDKILPEIKLSPRQIFTRSKVRADVTRIIELYKRQGRFAATVEPKMVELSQNRVDIVFEINEGPKSKVRQINIIGNEKFSDGELRGEMLTKQARLTSFFSSNTSYDPDRLAYDQQLLRQFYLTEGYADFRVVSAVAELTPDKKDFIITYVVEEGERYKFADVSVDSQIRDFDSKAMSTRLPMKTGDWYDAKQVEDTVEQLTELAGTFGYAFADVSPNFSRNPDDKTMSVQFVLREAPRVYVERIDVNGNTLTQDKVLRREFRVAEGDAFNSLAVKRSTSRINSLGYFQENFEINQVEGSQPDRIVLEANVEEQATGQLQLSAGFSSLESFILAGSIQQRNFRGRGQTVGLSLNYSRYSKSAQVSFTEPYVFDRNISAGVDIYRRDLNSFNFRNNQRNTTYKQATTGLSLRAGVPLTEYMSAVGSYTFNYDDVSLGNEFFTNGACDPTKASRFLCEAIGKRSSSIVGLTLNYDTLDSRLRPTRGETISWTTEFAGLGGSERYLRSRARLAKYWGIGSGFIFSLAGEGGWIKGLKDSNTPGTDNVRLINRFFLGEPQMRGFDIRGVGPRIVRLPYFDDDNDPTTPDVPQALEDALNSKNRLDDSLGGRAYYLGRAELEIPLGSGAREMGLRPSVFVDVGSLFGITEPILQDFPNGVPLTNDLGQQLYLQSGTDASGNEVFSSVTNPISPSGATNTPQYRAAGFKEVFVGDSVSPRVSVGFGVNWNSPFGPFRIDVSKVLKSQVGDDTKTFSFNVGTQF